VDLSKKACRIRTRQAFLFLLFFAPCSAWTQEQQAPTIRVEVSRVDVGVIVTDSRGNFVGGLKRSDFQVFDNGVEQPIVGFLANDDPAQVVLMMECGPPLRLFGMENILKADALIAHLAPQDKIAIVCYSTGPVLQFALSSNLSASRAALQNLGFSSGFASLNLSRSLLEVLNWLHSIPGKKTVVLISSGIDSSPPQIPNQFQSAIIASEVRVLAVSTSGPVRNPPKRKNDPEDRQNREEWKDALKEADETLKNVAGYTGGRAYFPKNVKDYDRIYTEIAELVRHEYNLAFTPQTFDGKLHTLTVTAKPAARTDHRQAYLAPPAD
jgi:Ca-activated chloride channel homolog